MVVVEAMVLYVYPVYTVLQSKIAWLTVAMTHRCMQMRLSKRLSRPYCFLNCELLCYSALMH